MVIVPAPLEGNLNRLDQGDHPALHVKLVVKERWKKFETPINKEIRNFYSIVTLN
jgi:hypothetical protein